MSLQPIGLATLTVGLACLMLEARLAPYALATATPFLSLGGRMQLAHLLLAFPRPSFFLATIFGATALGNLRA